VTNTGISAMNPWWSCA